MKEWDGKIIEAKSFIFKIVKKVSFKNDIGLTSKTHCGMVLLEHNLLQYCHKLEKRMMTICVRGSFGHRKLILGPNKHEAVRLHL